MAKKKKSEWKSQDVCTVQKNKMPKQQRKKFHLCAEDMNGNILTTHSIPMWWLLGRVQHSPRTAIQAITWLKLAHEYNSTSIKQIRNRQLTGNTGYCKMFSVNNSGNFIWIVLWLNCCRQCGCHMVCFIWNDPSAGQTVNMNEASCRYKLADVIKVCSSIHGVRVRPGAWFWKLSLPHSLGKLQQPPACGSTWTKKRKCSSGSWDILN